MEREYRTRGVGENWKTNKAGEDDITFNECMRHHGSCMELTAGRGK